MSTFTPSYSTAPGGGLLCNTFLVTDTSNYEDGNTIKKSDFQYRRIVLKDYLLGTTLGTVDLPSNSNTAIFSTSILNVVLNVELFLIPSPPGSVYNVFSNVLNPCI